jgi:hypothetical protein
MMEELGLDFLAELDFHLTNGWVYSGEDAFIMATTENLSQIREINSQNCIDKDTWYVYAYVGNLRRVLGLVPFQLKYVAFRRDNGRIKVYDMNRLLQKMENL